MTRPRAECGTHSAYLRHLYLREPIDKACRLAHAAYQRDYRKKMPFRAKLRHAEREAARRDALARLAEAHPGRAEELIAELADGRKAWQVRISARRRLAAEHPQEFARLFAAAKTERGITAS